MELIKFKNYILYLIKTLTRNVTRILFFFPIKDKRILFSSYLGEKVTGNPKSIYDFLSNQYSSQYEYIWSYNYNRDKVDLPKNVKVIKRFSLKWFFFVATSKIIVDNCTPPFLIPRRKKQLYIETWHAGGAYKKIGIASSKNEISKKISNKKISSVNMFISSSRVFTEENIKTGYNYKGEVLQCGMPRNDVFFNKNSIKNSAKKVKEYYSLKEFVVLYAPTFRGDIKQSNEIDIVLNIKQLHDILKVKFGKDVSILTRCHHWDKHHYNFGNDVIDAGNYPDMQELLCASDILITDYSSSMWDYALLGRPCLLYTPDIDQYIKDRGFFTPPEQWPGIICRNMDELCNEIENLDEESCAARAKDYLELMGSYETGHATEIISNRIISYINGD